MLSDDSERDEIGKEMAPTARIWPEYVKVATEFDDRTVEGWNSIVDVMLIFAGLFSAILTAFLVQTYQLLNQNSNSNSSNVSLSVLQEISASLKSMATNTTVEETAASASTTFTPSATVVWVNGLWFTSLTSSLGVSSVAMLLKQWIHAYRSDLVGPPQVQARLRQRRYAALLTWKMPTLIASLPLLLSISLMEFLAGLAIFLFSLNGLIAALALAVISAIFVIHIVSLILPALTNCPYKTAVSSRMYQIMYPCRALCSLVVTIWWILIRKYHATTQFVKNIQYAVYIRNATNILKALSLILMSPLIVVYPLAFLPLSALLKWIYTLQWVRSIISNIGYLRYYYWFPPPYLLWIIKIYPFTVWLGFQAKSCITTSARYAWEAILRWKRGPTELQSELRATELEGSTLDGQVILWLLNASTHERTKGIAVKSIAGISRNKASATILRQGGALLALRNALQNCIKLQEVVTPRDAELYARGLLCIHNSTRLYDVESDDSSRTADAKLVHPLSSSSIREVAMTGVAAALMIDEMVTLLEQHVEGVETVTSFHLPLVIDTLSHEFATRTRWKGDFWATSTHGWEGWSRRIVPKLVALLSSDPREAPSPLDTAIAVALSVFACGYSIQDVQALEAEERRRASFHKLILIALTPILKYPVKFGYEITSPAHVRTLIIRAIHALRCHPELCSQEELHEILSGETGALTSLLQVSEVVQNIDDCVLALTIMAELPSTIFPDLVCLQFTPLLRHPSSQVRVAVLLFLENLCESPQQAIDIVTCDIAEQLISLFNSDIQNRPQIFHILGSVLLVCTRTRTKSAAHLDKLISQGIFGVIRSFFSTSFTLTNEEVQDWVRIMLSLCKRYKAEVRRSGALAALIDSQRNHWRAAELFHEYQSDIEAMRSIVESPGQDSNAEVERSAANAAMVPANNDNINAARKPSSPLEHLPILTLDLPS